MISGQQESFLYLIDVTEIWPSRKLKLKQLKGIQPLFILLPIFVLLLF